MEELTKLIKEDMKPALGVTEPGAIAFAVSTAKAHMHGAVEKVKLKLNSGMYKNAFTCGIPGTGKVGNYYAAALGIIAADPAKGLECLEGIGAKEEAEAEKLVSSGMIEVSMSEITSRIFIEAQLTGHGSEATVTIRDAHTNIVRITENGKTVFEKKQKHGEAAGNGTAEASDKTNANADYVHAHSDAVIHKYTLRDIYNYACNVPAEDLEFIKDAYRVNYELLEEGLHSAKTTYAPFLLKKNGGKEVSEDERKTAQLFCNAAIEARVIGLSKPAMSITGSGAHGIIATMPLYAAYKVNAYSEEQLLRATALSYLICMYIKEYSGKLSAFCGCAIAAGTGMACALAMLRGGDDTVMEKVINNMSSSITGMICDGGNQGCTMKGIVAVDAAYDSVEFAMDGVYIYNVHGINGSTPEETMRNMGLIASPGMVGTEKTIVDILNTKG